MLRNTVHSHRQAPSNGIEGESNRSPDKGTDFPGLCIVPRARASRTRGRCDEETMRGLQTRVKTHRSPASAPLFRASHKRVLFHTEMAARHTELGLIERNKERASAEHSTGIVAHDPRSFLIVLGSNLSLQWFSIEYPLYGVEYRGVIVIKARLQERERETC